MIELNRIYNEDCMETMSKMDDEFIDLIVTSPPYCDIRSYRGYEFDFHSIVKELYRVTKTGGVVVWIVGDQVINGSETGTPYKQVLYFRDIGFNIHDSMIYQKDSISFPEKNRYNQIFEFMFILSKGKPKTVNLLKDRENKCYNGRKHIKGHFREADGNVKRHNKQNLLQKKGARYNIWRISSGHQKSTMDKEAFEHPAIFPEQLAKDHILSWSNEGEIVYDPMAGSGTVPKMAVLYNRNWIASEISEDYCNIIRKRLNKLKIVDI